MTRPISTEVSTGTVGPVTLPGFLVEIDFASAIFRASSRSAITWNGNVFVPFGMKVTGLGSDGKSSSSGKIQFDDLDNALGTLILGETVGGANATVWMFYGDGSTLGATDPTSGEVYYRDHNLTAADDDGLTLFRREHVGFVFQFYNLIPSLTALENVALVTEIAENPFDPVAALEMVGLGNRRDHFPSQLSGGEQQRVAIARAVAKRPDVLLCDEPTGALDYATGKLVLEVLERVNRELGTIVAIITHNARSEERRVGKECRSRW